MKNKKIYFLCFCLLFLGIIILGIKVFLLKEQLKNKQITGILLTDCCALEIIDNNYKIIKSEDNACAYKAYWKNNQFYQEEIQEFGVLDDLNNDYKSLLLREKE